MAGYDEQAARTRMEAERMQLEIQEYHAARERYTADHEAAGRGFRVGTRTQRPHSPRGWASDR